MRMPAAARKRRLCIDLPPGRNEPWGNRGALTYLLESCDGITCLSLVKRLSTKIWIVDAVSELSKTRQATSRVTDGLVKVDPGSIIVRALASSVKTVRVSRLQN